MLTVLIDHMGYDEEAPSTAAIKFPRGILNCFLSGHSQAEIEWRLTRGLLNEGSMYAKREGYFLSCPLDAE